MRKLKIRTLKKPTRMLAKKDYGKRLARAVRLAFAGKLPKGTKIFTKKPFYLKHVHGLKH